MSIQRLVVAAAAALLLPSLPATAAVWPSGVAPCNTTLDACVDGTASGQLIEIATNGPITESVTMADKELTLQPAAGFAPVFALGGSFTVTSPAVGARLTVHRLTFDNHPLSAFAGDGHTMTLDVFDSTFVSHNRDAISVGADGTSSGVVVDVHRNHFTLTNDGGNEGGALQVGNFDSWTIDLHFTGNFVSQQGGDGSGSLSLYSTSGRTVVYVANNEIRRTGSNRGLLIRHESDDEVVVQVLGNLIAGAADTNGAAVEIAATDAAAPMSFTVQNNTLAEGNLGLVASHPATALPEVFRGTVFNNIFANFSTTGYTVGVDGNEPLVDNHHNLFWNATASDPVGAATLFADPLFVGGGNYRLQPASPARNTGTDVMALSNTDLDGTSRPADGLVDIGAYELVGVALEVPTASGVALGALAILLAALGIGLLRR